VRLAGADAVGIGVVREYHEFFTETEISNANRLYEAVARVDEENDRAEYQRLKAKFEGGGK
jgi:hypothetical protein